MFSEAVIFNCDLSKWDVSSVTDMARMFSSAKSFKQTLCGAAWIHSKASKTDMFKGSPGEIARALCGPVPPPERELIARTSIAMPVSTSAITSIDTMACPKCGKFKRSGRVSCCAPGGAWYKNCGGAGNKNLDHRWSEGAAACKLDTTTTTISSACPKCSTIAKS